MLVGNKHYRTIWLKENDERVVQIIDQRYLPHKFIIEDLHSLHEVVTALKDMHVRGAGLIGAAAGYGMYLAAMEALIEKSFEDYLMEAASELKASRPTAVNLEGAVKRSLEAISKGTSRDEKIKLAKNTATQIADEDAESCRMIGKHGLTIIEQLSKKKENDIVHILTHCNAGWLALVDYGSALAPIYEAFGKGIGVHVWVDETRPRNQGASLTAWELMNHGIPHTIIADNTGGHLMQHGMVDMVITGADRVSRTGDVANKIGTYLKALASFDNRIPFYVALPSSTFDLTISDGLTEIPIEERDPDEVKYITGLCEGELKRVLLTPPDSPALNIAFDVTPARLISGLITELGICRANAESIQKLLRAKKQIS
jgi:methylthioribose-1-phosphate isomerase